MMVKIYVSADVVYLLFYYGMVSLSCHLNDACCLLFGIYILQGYNMVKHGMDFAQDLKLGQVSLTHTPRMI